MTPSIRRLPILHHLLHQLCMLSTSLRDLGSAMRGCLTFSFFGILCQSNFTPGPVLVSTTLAIWLCRGDIIKVPVGLQLVVQWTTMVQVVRHNHLAGEHGCNWGSGSNMFHLSLLTSHIHFWGFQLRLLHICLYYNIQIILIDSYIPCYIISSIVKLLDTRI